jgi:hypothetical protein
MNKKHPKLKLLPQFFILLNIILNLKNYSIMKIIISTIFLIFLSVIANAQNKLDSLSQLRSNLISDKNKIEAQIESVEKRIISEILQFGYEHVIKTSYKGQAIDLKDVGNGGNTIAKLMEGDKVTVIGKESIYFKVKFDDKIGLIYLSNPDYPITLLNDHKYKDHIEGKKESKVYSSKSTNTNCSSTQCSGQTQKGSRCRNMTTSCTGRCYLH